MNFFTKYSILETEIQGNTRENVMFTPRYYQIDSVRAVSKAFQENRTDKVLVDLPTGSGKSIVIYMLCAGMFKSNRRVLVLTHRTELVKQNHAELERFGSHINTSICSGDLKSYDVSGQIVFGNVSTYYKFVHESNPFDYAIIDEAQRVGSEDDSLYQYVLKEEIKKNPNLGVVGLTATPFNDKGYLTDQGIFNRIVYQKTYKELVDEGFLSPLITPGFLEFKDNTQIFIGKDENEEDFAVKAPILVDRTIQCAQIDGRKKWLVFTPTISQAEIFNDELLKRGIVSDVIHSKKKSSQMITDFRYTDKWQCLVNVAMFVEGVNVPSIDMIVYAAKIDSLVKWWQSLGRGTRKSDETGKKNCMVVDFGENISRLGQLGDPIVFRTGNGVNPFPEGNGGNSDREYGKGLNEVADVGISDTEKFEVVITGVHFKPYITAKGIPMILAYFIRNNEVIFTIFYNVFHAKPYVAKLSRKNLERDFPVNARLAGIETLNDYTSLLNQRYALARGNATVVRKKKYFNLLRINYLEE